MGESLAFNSSFVARNFGLLWLAPLLLFCSEGVSGGGVAMVGEAFSLQNKPKSVPFTAPDQEEEDLVNEEGKILLLARNLLAKIMFLAIIPLC